MPKINIRTYREIVRFIPEMPVMPENVYEGWSWKDIGIESIGQYLVFEEARKFVRSLNLKSYDEWRKYYKSGDKPNNIPSGPQYVYKNDWISVGDWLGTGSYNVGSVKPSYKKLCLLILSSKKNGEELNNLQQYKTFARKNKLPACPDKIYSEFIGWRVFLGKQFRDFNDARKYARSLHLKSPGEWDKYCNTDQKPIDIPHRPNSAYRKHGWVDMYDFLGIQKPFQFRIFSKARSFVHSLGLSSQKEWNKWRKSKSRPLDIPSDPSRVYKSCGWLNWGDWFGTGYIANQNRIFCSFVKARKFIHSLNLKSQIEWKAYCKSHNKPKDIPSNPNLVYKENWLSWYDWLGTK